MVDEKIEDSQERLEGEVKWFSNKLNFGFIEVEGREKDLFVHFSQIEGMDGYRTLKAQQKVSFAIVTGEDGREQAGGVNIIEKSQSDK